MKAYSRLVVVISVVLQIIIVAAVLGVLCENNDVAASSIMLQENDTVLKSPTLANPHQIADSALPTPTRPMGATATPTPTPKPIRSPSTIVTVIDSKTFPDKVFREYVLDNIDSNNDSRLSVAEIELATWIELPNQSLRDLSGIEFFYKLETLDVSNNELTSLDLSHCYELQYLGCQNNHIESLDLSNCSRLESLSCFNNQMTDLVLPNHSLGDIMVFEGNRLDSVNVNKVYAGNAPVTDVWVETDTVNRPGRLTCYVKLNSQQFGITRVDVSFAFPNDYRTLDGHWAGDARYNGIVEIDITIPNNIPIGDYRLDHINFTGDDSGESIEPLYSLGTGMGGIGAVCLKDNVIKYVSFQVEDEFDYYQHFSLSHPDIVSKINSTTEGQALRVYIDNSSKGIVPKGVFDAIKGRDVTIVFYKDAYQWIINGKDVVNATKDVCLLLSIEQIDKSVYGTSDDTVKITFEPNGLLPGRCEVRIKSDYLFQLYGLKGKLYMYYNNNGQLQLESKSNFELVFDGTDKWCYFDVYHNSEFIISGSKINITANPTSVPSSASTETGVAGFVERLYSVALGRASDPNGKADWINRVTNQGYTGAELAEEFLYSDEFLTKNISNSEFLDVLYATFFNRMPDQEGKNNWLNAMESGMTKKQVIRGFIDSTEWANLCLTYGIASGTTAQPNITVAPSQNIIDFATRLYTSCLGRDADQGGLNDWAAQLANMKISGSVAAHGFFFSEEFIGYNFNNDDYVTRLYRTFMGREPDPAGFADWVGQLNNGASRETVFQGFAGSAEWAGICAEYGILK